MVVQLPMSSDFNFLHFYILSSCIYTYYNVDQYKVNQTVCYACINMWRYDIPDIKWKTAVTPLLTYWNYHNFAESHLNENKRIWYVFINLNGELTYKYNEKLLWTCWLSPFTNLFINCVMSIWTLSCSFLLLSGVPDYFDRNKILSGYDLSHYQVPHCIKSFLFFCLICVYSSQFSILFWIMYLL